MAWADSRVFRQFLADVVMNTAALDLGGTPDTFNVALYNNTTTPDRNVTAANSAYAVAQWVVGNEVSESGQWAAGGVALTSPVIDATVSNVVFWDAADTASGAAADLAAVFGCLVYDASLATPVDNQGVCYNYFGGTNSVTNGTFTVVWNANGIWRATL